MDIVVIFGYDLERHGDAIFPSETLANRLYKAVGVFNRIPSGRKIIIAVEGKYINTIGPHNELLGVERNPYPANMKLQLENMGVSPEKVYSSMCVGDIVMQFISSIHLAMTVAIPSSSMEGKKLKRTQWELYTPHIKTLHFVTSGFEMADIITAVDHFQITKMNWEPTSCYKKEKKYPRCRYYEALTPAGIDAVERRYRVSVDVWNSLKKYPRDSIKEILHTQGFWYGMQSHEAMPTDTLNQDFSALDVRKG